MVSVVAELAQQIIQALAFRHKHCRTQQGADVQFGRALQLQQIFGQQDANDVFFFAFEDRKTRVRCFNHMVQHFVKRGFNVQQIHARGGHHDIARGHVGHANHPFEHQAALGIDDVVVLGLGQRFDQLVCGVWARMEKFGEFL